MGRSRYSCRRIGVMKTLILTVIFALFTATLAGRDPNALYLSVQPGDRGLGIRYDRYVGRTGIFLSGARGGYKFNDGGYIKDHYRFALGGIYQPRQKLNNPYIKDYFTFGLSYHLYGAREYNPIFINENVFKPWSFEFGGGVRLFKFAFGLRMDIIKWEGIVDFGWRF